MKASTYIEHGKFDTAPLIIHRFKQEDIKGGLPDFQEQAGWGY